MFLLIKRHQILSIEVVTVCRIDHVFHAAVAEQWKLSSRPILACAQWKKKTLLLQSRFKLGLCLDSMWPRLAGVGWSRERAMPRGLHLPFRSCSWCLLDPLRATPSHWLIWQHGCDHRCGDRWKPTLFSADLRNTMSPNKALDLLLRVFQFEFVLTWIWHWIQCTVLCFSSVARYTETEQLWCLYFPQILERKLCQKQKKSHTYLIELLFVSSDHIAAVVGKQNFLATLLHANLKLVS